jgi:outer membrane protein OmpA-like peptidoglycan-associated protein
MNTKVLIVWALAVALGACATNPAPNPMLENARAAVRSAEVDPNVNKYAALDLAAARGDLSVAEDAALHHEEEQVNQSAYLAMQKARIAQVHAAAMADDARVAAGQTERDQIMLAARSREAENAKQAAVNAKAETQVALAQRDQAAQETARAQAELDALKATPTPRGQVITLGDVLFDSGKADLKSGARRRLDQLVQFLVEHPARRVQIDGFTDSVGPDAYNEDLSERRADAVRSVLLSGGIDASRIGTQGYGKAYPVASNDDSSGRQLNRRVEVVIGNDSGSQIAPRTGL